MLLWVAIGADRTIHSIPIPTTYGDIDPSTATNEGTLPSAFTSPSGMTYDPVHQVLWIVRSQRNLRSLPVPAAYGDIDPSTAANEGQFSSNVGSTITAMTYDRDHQVLWVVGNSRYIYSLPVPDTYGSINPGNAVREGRFPSGFFPSGLTYDPDHKVLWAIERTGRELYSLPVPDTYGDIDPSTATNEGDWASGNVTGLTYDPENQVLWGMDESSNTLYSLSVPDTYGDIDPSTATSEGNLPSSLFFPGALAYQPPHRPTADAGAAQTVGRGQSFSLDASGSTDSGGGTLTYAWTQVSPATPQITLTGANTATPTGTAPNVNVDTVFAFRVTVTNPGGETDTADVVLTVQSIQPIRYEADFIGPTVGGSVSLNRVTVIRYEADFAGPTVAVSASVTRTAVTSVRYEADFVGLTMGGSASLDHDIPIRYEVDFAGPTAGGSITLGRITTIPYEADFAGPTAGGSVTLDYAAVPTLKYEADFAGPTVGGSVTLIHEIILGQLSPPTLTQDGDAIDIAWTDGGFTRIDDYDVQYRRENTTRWQNWSHTGTDRAASILGLQLGRAYRVRVRGKVGTLVGEWSDAAGIVLLASSLQAAVLGSYGCYGIRTTNAPTNASGAYANFIREDREYQIVTYDTGKSNSLRRMRSRVPGEDWGTWGTAAGWATVTDLDDVTDQPRFVRADRDGMPSHTGFGGSRYALVLPPDADASYQEIYYASTSRALVWRREKSGERDNPRFGTVRAPASGALTWSAVYYNRALLDSTEYNIVTATRTIDGVDHHFQMVELQFPIPDGERVDVLADLDSTEFRTPADAAAWLLSDAVYGLGQDIDADAFVTARGELLALGYGIEGGLYSPNQAHTLLLSLMVRGSRLYRNASQEWTMRTDQAVIHPRAPIALREGGPGPQTIMPGSVRRRRGALSNAVNAVRILCEQDFGFDGGAVFLAETTASLDVPGVEELIEHPFLDATGARAEAGYLLLALRAHSRVVTLKTDLRGLQVGIDQVVTVQVPHRHIDGDFLVREVARQWSGDEQSGEIAGSNDFELVPYDPDRYTRQGDAIHRIGQDRFGVATEFTRPDTGAGFRVSYESAGNLTRARLTILPPETNRTAILFQVFISGENQAVALAEQSVPVEVNGVVSADFLLTPGIQVDYQAVTVNENNEIGSRSSLPALLIGQTVSGDVRAGRGFAGYSDSVLVTDLQASAAAVNADEEWYIGSFTTWATTLSLVWQENDNGAAARAERIGVGGLLTVYQDTTRFADYRVTAASVVGNKVTIAGSLIEDSGTVPAFDPAGDATAKTVEIRFNPVAQDGEPGRHGLAGYSHSVTVTDLQTSSGAVNQDEEWWMEGYATGNWPNTLDLRWQENDAGAAAQASLIQVGSLLTVYQNVNRWADYRVSSTSVSGNVVTIGGSKIEDSGTGPDFDPAGSTAENTTEIHFNPKGEDGDDGEPGRHGLAGYSHSVTVTNLITTKAGVNQDEEWWMSGYAGNVWPNTLDLRWQENDAGAAAEAGLIQVGSLLTVYQNRTRWADYRVSSTSVSGNVVTIGGTKIEDSGTGPDFNPTGSAAENTTEIHFNPKGEDGQPGLHGLAGYSHSVTVTNLITTKAGVNQDEEWWMSGYAGNVWPNTLDLRWQENDAGAAAEAGLIQVGSLLTVYQNRTRWADYRVSSTSVSGNLVTIGGTKIEDSGTGPDFNPTGSAAENTTEIHFNPKGEDGDDGEPGRHGLAGYSHSVTVTNLITAKADVNADEEWWMSGYAGNVWPNTLDLRWQENDAGAAAEASRIQVGSLLTVYQNVNRWADYRVSSTSVSGNVVTIGGARIEDSGTGPDFDPAGSAAENTTEIHFNPKGEDGEPGEPGSGARPPGTFARVVTTRPLGDAAYATQAEATVTANLGTENPPVQGDIVTLHLADNSYVETRRFDGTSWVTTADYIDGGLVINGTVVSEKIASLSAAKINTGNLIVQTGVNNGVDEIQVLGGADMAFQAGTTGGIAAQSRINFQANDGTVKSFIAGDRNIANRPHDLYILPATHRDVGLNLGLLGEKEFDQIVLRALRFLMTGTLSLTGNASISGTLTVGGRAVSGTISALQASIPQVSPVVGVNIRCDVAGGKPPYDYQWYTIRLDRTGQQTIAGATDRLYAPIAANINAGFRCIVTDSSFPALTAQADLAIASVDVFTVEVDHNEPIVNEEIKCVATPEGLNYSYQWIRHPDYRPIRNQVRIPGATGASYIPTSADIGSTLSCEVTSGSAVRYARPRLPVREAGYTAIVARVSDTTPRAGQTLTCIVSGGVGGAYTYEWVGRFSSGLSYFTGPTTQQMTVPDDWIGLIIWCVVKSGGGVVQTQETSKVAARSDTPDLYGRMVDDTPVEAQRFSIYAEGGTAPYSYQWLYGSPPTNIQGNADTITVPSEAVGSFLSCIISDSAGEDITVTSVNIVEDTHIGGELTVNIGDAIPIEGEVTFALVSGGPTGVWGIEWQQATATSAWEAIDVYEYDARNDEPPVHIVSPEMIEGFKYRLQVSDGNVVRFSGETHVIPNTPLSASIAIDGLTYPAETLPIQPFVGHTATVSYVGSSGTPTFQWRKDGVDIPGATTNQVYLRSSFQGSIISCHVTRGSEDVEAAFELEVLIAPELEVEFPQGTNLNPLFSVAVTVRGGTNIYAYSWDVGGFAQSNDNYKAQVRADTQDGEMINLTIISGEETKTIQSSALDNFGDITVASDPGPTGVFRAYLITSSPSRNYPDTISNSSHFGVRVLNSPGTNVYQWQRKHPLEGDWENIPNATADTIATDLSFVSGTLLTDIVGYFIRCCVRSSGQTIYTEATLYPIMYRGELRYFSTNNPVVGIPIKVYAFNTRSTGPETSLNLNSPPWRSVPTRAYIRISRAGQRLFPYTRTSQPDSAPTIYVPTEADIGNYLIFSPNSSIRIATTNRVQAAP